MKNKLAKPFLKWAGGKTRLLKQFELFFPYELKSGKIQKYIEPFLGSGAVFFHIAQKYKIKSASLIDRNEDLILTYKVLQENADDLCDELEKLSKKYHALNQNKKEKFFYETREKFNKVKPLIDYKLFNSLWINRAAQVIFLNKTCYNGLFRMNKKGDFNTPFGKYLNPTIFDCENLQNVSRLLQVAELKSGDFHIAQHDLSSKTFIYFDPPYRPLNKTSNFTAYSKHEFNDEEQIRLAKLFYGLSKTVNVKLMLSNSDPKNENKNDSFFEKLYKGFAIHEVLSSRSINSNGAKRGKIKELLVLNYSMDSDSKHIDDSKQLKLFV